MRLLPVLLAVLIAVSAAKRDMNKPQKSPKSSRDSSKSKDSVESECMFTYQKKANRYISSATPQTGISSEQECQAACDGDASCVSFDFSKSCAGCYINTNATASLSKRKGTTNNWKVFTCGDCTYFPYPGQRTVNGQEQSGVATPTSCLQDCTSSDSCSMAHWDNSTNKCFFSSEHVVSALVDSANDISYQRRGCKERTAHGKQRPACAPTPDATTTDATITAAPTPDATTTDATTTAAPTPDATTTDATTTAAPTPDATTTDATTTAAPTPDATTTDATTTAAPTPDATTPDATTTAAPTLDAIIIEMYTNGKPQFVCYDAVTTDNTKNAFCKMLGSPSLAMVTQPEAIPRTDTDPMWSWPIDCPSDAEGLHQCSIGDQIATGCDSSDNPGMLSIICAA